MRLDGFRQDINGLRAVAVLLVIMFHVGLRDWGGGFIGVDVFFVISGYLIIPRLHKAVHDGGFSFADFLGKRIRRLVPAIVPVIIFTSAVGLFWLGDSAFDEFMSSAVAAASFVSNIFFMLTRGYFERAVDKMLLLHTWSLGVEFQFYVLAPLIFVFFRRYAVAALAITAAGSFAISVYLTDTGSTAAYYSIASRFWQLAVGGIVGITQPALNKRLSSRWIGYLRLLGLIVIIGCALSYESTLPFPGWAAVLPTLASCLVLMVPTNRPDLSYALLSSRSMGWVGDRSYSIYLWHWPLIVLQAGEGRKIAAAIIAVALGAISYRLVELPTQKRSFWRRPLNTAKLAVLPGLTAAVLLLATQHTTAISGLRDVLPLSKLRMSKSMADPLRNEYLGKVIELGFKGEHGLCSLDTLLTVEAAGSCLDATRAPNATLIVGDSHARDVMLALRQAYPNRTFVLLHQSGCAPATYRKCFPDLESALPGILERGRYQSTILASRWSDAPKSAVEATLRILARNQSPVSVIGPGPFFKQDVSEMLVAADEFNPVQPNPITLPNSFRFDVRARNKELSELAASIGAVFVDRFSYLCPDEECPGFVPGKVSMMYVDSEHLSLPAISYLAEKLRDDSGLKSRLN